MATADGVDVFAGVEAVDEVFHAEDRAVEEAEDDRGDSDGHQDFAEGHFLEEPHEGTDEYDNGALSDVAKHHSEEEEVGDRDERGGVHFVV